jgi:hypothetical protein
VTEWQLLLCAVSRFGGFSFCETGAAFVASRSVTSLEVD